MSERANDAANEQTIAELRTEVERLQKLRDAVALFEREVASFGYSSDDPTQVYVRHSPPHSAPSLYSRLSALFVALNAAETQTATITEAP